MTVKSRFLELLEQNKGEVISGEAAAEKLQCTRAAIWKAAKALRGEGYEIDAAQNRGYRLSPGLSPISAEAFKLHLKTQGISVKVFDELDSTNRQARRELMDGTIDSEGVVIARSQKEGRGRRGRTFFSPEGGLYLSVILRPETTMQQSLILTTAAATAVFLAVRDVCKVDLSIKWVNDLYLDSRKVCGILTEAITNFETGDIEYAIVGIGLNLKFQEPVPVELQEKIGELTNPEGEQIDPNRLGAAIVDHLLEEVQRTEVSEIYREHNMIPGHRIHILDGERSRDAKALSINSDGTLVVEEADGTEKTLFYGEVSVVPTKE
ncbi:MAG: biotin--[acetyl-CoA-carboxylase] ligase [Eubacteriales bacterium]|nr:biotin--[acetyl-CoA-carboxylase] ligase [Eubacteriales bacterium]